MPAISIIIMLEIHTLKTQWQSHKITFAHAHRYIIYIKLYSGEKYNDITNMVLLKKGIDKVCLLWFLSNIMK